MTFDLTSEQIVITFEIGEKFGKMKNLIFFCDFKFDFRRKLIVNLKKVVEKILWK